MKLETPVTGGRLRVVFLIGRWNASTQLSIAQVCQTSGVEPVAVLIDTGRPGSGQRWRNLRRNVGREGIGYVFHRGVTALREFLERRADRVIPASEVEDLLRQAFPARDLQQLSQIHGFQILEVGSLNGKAAEDKLRSLSADLGVVLGTRVLKRRIFEIPRLGCVNLHKGSVPEYRGMPPGFWELYDGASSAGVTVHLVDDGLDTGDVLGTTDIPIHPKETPESLSAKLNHEGSRLLASVVAQIRQGTAERSPQPKSHHASRTRPTRAQQAE